MENMENLLATFIKHCINRGLGTSGWRTLIISYFYFLVEPLSTLESCACIVDRRERSNVAPLYTMGKGFICI